MQINLSEVRDMYDSGLNSENKVGVVQLAELPPEEAVHELFAYVSAQNEELSVDSDRLKAIGVLVGPAVVLAALNDYRANGLAEVTHNEDLIISKVTFVSEVKSLEPNEPIVEPEAPEAIEQSPDTQQPQPDSPSLAAEGVNGSHGQRQTNAAEDIAALLGSRGGIITKGIYRSASTEIIDTLKDKYAPGTLRSTISKMIAEGVLSAVKVTPNAKLFEEIRLVTEDEVASERPIASELPKQDQLISVSKVLEEYKGRVVQNYIKTLIKSNGIISCTDGDVPMVTLLNAVNAMTHENDPQASEVDLIKAQARLERAGVIEVVKQDENNPRRITGIKFGPQIFIDSLFTQDEL